MNEVNRFLDTIDNESRRNDARELAHLMHEATNAEPRMWGSSIIGFGTHHYKYETGREGDTVAVGFAPRKDALVLYGLFMYDHNADLAEELGKVKMGKGCLYIKSLADVDIDKLISLTSRAFEERNNA